MNKTLGIKENVRFIANKMVTGNYSAKELPKEKLEMIKLIENIYIKQIELTNEIITNHISIDEFSTMKKIDLISETIFSLIITEAESKLGGIDYNTDIDLVNKMSMNKR